jgi:multidrug efflux pump subunit AcrB
MADIQQRAAAVILGGPDVATVGSAIGGGSSSGNNTGRIFISLNHGTRRKATEAAIIQRLRPKLAQVPGITTYLQPLETIQIGGPAEPPRVSVQLQDVDIAELQEWAPKLEAKLKSLPGLQMSPAISSTPARN